MSYTLRKSPTVRGGKRIDSGHPARLTLSRAVGQALGWVLGSAGGPGLGGLVVALQLTLLSAAPGLAQAPVDLQRFVRFEHGDMVSWGLEQGDQVRPLPGGTLFEAAAAADTGEYGEAIPSSAVHFLTPVDPLQTGKVVGVAVNTRRPGRTDPIPHPRWFAKFPTSLNSEVGDIELPPEAGNLNYEGELVLVIGREGRHISEAEARDYVFGVTVGNDYSENTWYGERNGVDEPTRMISKGTDGWAPIGRAIVRGADYSDLRLTTTLNGELVQEGRTSDLVNSIDNLIAHLSRYVTLQPGDVIFTGTVLFKDGARRRMQPGDIVEVTIDGLGSVRNKIVSMSEGH